MSVKRFERIDWFKTHGYLLGQNKNKFYIIHPQDGRKDFDTIQDAEGYVESMVAHRKRIEGEAV